MAMHLCTNGLTEKGSCLVIPGVCIKTLSVGSGGIRASHHWHMGTLLMMSVKLSTCTSQCHKGSTQWNFVPGASTWVMVWVDISAGAVVQLAPQAVVCGIICQWLWSLGGISGPTKSERKISMEEWSFFMSPGNDVCVAQKSCELIVFVV